MTVNTALIRLGLALLMGYGVYWMIRESWRIDREN